MEQDYESIFPEKRVVYASFGLRLGAYILDTIILSIPTIAINVANRGAMITNLCINLVIGWLYYTLQESGAMQATLGKKAVGIKVTDMNGERISFGIANGRYFGKFLSGLILLIGYFMMLGDDKHQTLHDKLAGTLVVMA